MSLFIFLPVISFILIFILLLRTTAIGFRLALLWASLVWNLAAVAMVESFSVFHGLTRSSVAIGWGVVGLVALGGIFFQKPSLSKRQIQLKEFSIWDFGALCLTAVIILIVGINAFFAAPNNWDSMTYHLPRVMHWIQNQSVEHYPTPILRQLYQAPGAEFLILHFQILSQDDHFVNLVQWVTMFGSILVLSLIAAELGVGKTGQILVGLLTATVPMGILQGSSTQNDYVVGFWLAGFVYFILRLIKATDKTSSRSFDVAGAGLSLAFAILTKGSAYIFAAPWIAYFLGMGLFKKRLTIVRDVLIVIFICLTINAGLYYRNIKLFGTPLSAGAEDYANKGNIISNTVSNVVRNTVLHLGTPIPAVNHFIKKRILVLQTLTGNPQNNSWDDFDILVPSTSEDVAGNPFHLLLIISVFFMVLLSKKIPPLPRNYIFMILTGFILFCALFKWQLYNSRLHLPLFLLSMPIIGLVFERIRPRWLTTLIVGGLIVAAVPPLFYNERHPLVGKKNVFNMSRMEQYFSYRQFMALPYVLSVKYAIYRHSTDVGLMLGVDDWEYPLWVLLKKANPDIRISHAGVKNISSSLITDGDKGADLIISELADAPEGITLYDKTYLKRQQFSFMSIYENSKP